MPPKSGSFAWTITGSTPIQYHLHLRFERAKKLLRETNLPIKAIAQQVGFPDPLHFSHQFRRHVALSPRGWREESRDPSHPEIWG